MSDTAASWSRRRFGHLIVAPLGALAVMAVVATSSPPAGAQGAPERPSDLGAVTFELAPAVDPGRLPPIALDKLRHARRSRFVELPTDTVSSALSASRVDLELFTDVVAELDGDGRHGPGADGSTTWSGNSPDGDYATLTFLGGRTIGTAAVDGVVYDISPVPGGRLLIVEEGRDFPDELEPLLDPAAHLGAGDGNSAPAPPGVSPPPSVSSGPVVDVLTWYDTAARTYYGGDAAALAELTATVNEVNAAYERSGVNQSVRSVGIDYVAYSGTGSSSDEITRWRSVADGFLDSVHVRRDQLGADLAALISPLSDGCGIGYLGGSASGAYGFSVSAPSCARGNLTYAHELGHNMGAGHGAPDGGGLFSYSNGYRDPVNGFRTIMAYNSASCAGGSCTRVGHFSSPTVLFNGLPTGSATQDNARTISERAVVTAAYRTPPSGVRGTVREVGTGTPVAGAFVALLRTSDFSVAAGAAADGLGVFTASAPPGSYYVYALDPTGAHRAGFHGAPTVLTVASGEFTDVEPGLSSLRGSVTATVTTTGSGAPVAGVWGVALSTGAANAGATEMAVVANASGVVSLPALRPGNHIVGFIDPTGAHATRFFPNSTDVPGSTPVAITAGDTTAANTALPPQAALGAGQSLSGTVTEEGTGIPLAGAMVVALRADDYQMVRGAVTNGSGAYTMSLAPGTYKVAVLDSSGRHDMEWFDNVPSAGLVDAASVTVPGVANAALRPNDGTVRGTITDDPSGVPLAGAWVVAIDPAGIAGGAVTAADGTYTIPGLAPGTYRATIVDPNGGRAQEYYDNSIDYAGGTPFNVTAGATATVNAGLASPASARDADWRRHDWRAP